MRIVWPARVVIFFLIGFLWSTSAIACGVPPSRIFLNKPVIVLPHRAVQLQVQVEGNTEKISEGLFGSTIASVINILNGVVSDTEFVLKLETPATSCSIVGEPGPDKYVVGFFLRDGDGNPVLTQDGLKIFEPILYFPRRNVEDEQKTAEHFRDRY
jgi:hypothetical protein